MQFMQIPSRGMLILIIFMSFLAHIDSLQSTLNPPAGMAFGRGIDDLVWIATMKSYLWDYADPFGPGNSSAFENPWLGSVYLLVFLGLFTTVFDAALVFHTVTFTFSVLFLITTYNIICLFVKQDAEKALLLYIFGSGSIGWLLHLFFKKTVDDIAPAALAHLVWMGGMSPTTVIYWSVSLVFGYLALLVFIQKNDNRSLLISGISLLVSLLVYPAFGIMIAALFFIYSFLHRNLWKYAKIFPFILSGMFPWLYFRGELYTAFLSWKGVANFYVFLFHGILLIPFVVYFCYKILHNIKQANNDMVFLIIWGTVVAAIATIPQNFIDFTQQRIIHMAWLPLSIMAFLGMKAFFRDKMPGVNFLSVAMLITVVCVPSMALWYYNAIAPDDAAFFPLHEYKALVFLRDEPQGNVLASYYLSLRAPYFANKRSLHGGGPTFELSIEEPIEEDYEKFYSYDVTDKEKRNILQKYDIRYVIFGEREMSISNGRFSPSSLHFLKKIYGNKTEVYLVDLA